MCRFRRLLAAALLCVAAAAPHAQDRFPGIGRAATPAEVKAWDIDVRPDFQGLPAGSGSVAKGMEVWEGKCASCHGVFGESNEVFSPLVGGTTEEDIRTGRVANLRRTDYPGRTTMMRVGTLSTLWDYINRAMPWNAPKSLTTEEVYAAFFATAAEEKTFQHGHTYGGNPLGAAVALANLRVFDEERTLERTRRNAERLGGWLERIGLPYDELYCSDDKVSRCREIGIDLLIDDSPVNLAAAVDAGMRAATISHPWNRDICEEEDIVCAPDWPSLARALEPLLQGAPR